MSLRGTLARIFAFSAIAAVAGMLFAWSGLYSVAATRGHWEAADLFFRFAMRKSVETHAADIAEPADLNTPDRVKLGAAHFATGCAPCHGAPGQEPNPISRHTLPPAPDLSHAARSWQPRELFWIVENGIKYTGMPAWVGRNRGDEAWSLVAFLQLLPDLDPRRYAELAKPDVARPERLFATAHASPSTAACGTCHGSETDPPASCLVPILNGQPVEMLAGALRAYASGWRDSGFMQPVATALDEADIDALAKHFAGLPHPAANGTATPAPAPLSNTLARGRELYERGDADRGIPACAGCHGAASLPAYPRLAGQRACYAAAQLRLWQQGGRAHGPLAAIMGPIARRLSQADIEAVSAWMERLPPSNRGATQ